MTFFMYIILSTVHNSSFSLHSQNITNTDAQQQNLTGYRHIKLHNVHAVYISTALCSVHGSVVNRRALSEHDPLTHSTAIRTSLHRLLVPNPLS